MMPTLLHKGIGTTMQNDGVQSFKAIARGSGLSSIGKAVGVGIGVMALAITAGFMVDALKGALRKNTGK